MYNIRAQAVSHFTTGHDATEEDQEGMSTFAHNCLKAFKRTIQPTVQDYADMPSQCTSVYFNSSETSSLSSSSSSTDEEDVESIMEVPKAILAVLQGKPFTGRHYAFLMTHPLYGKKTSANVAYSTNPMYDVHLHNTLAINDRTTSAAAPYWILDIVLGPFISAELAIECTREWVSHTRGKKSKRKKAVFLSQIYGVPMYSIATKPTVSLQEYLRENAPPKYLACYEKMIASAHSPQPRPIKRAKKKKGAQCVKWLKKKKN